MCYQFLSYPEPKPPTGELELEQLIVRLMTHYATLLEDDMRLKEMPPEEEMCAMIDRGLYFEDGLSFYFNLRKQLRVGSSKHFLYELVPAMILATAQKYIG